MICRIVKPHANLFYVMIVPMVSWDMIPGRTMPALHDGQEGRRQRLYEQRCILLAEIDRINEAIRDIENELNRPPKPAYLDRVE